MGAGSEGRGNEGQEDRDGCVASPFARETVMFNFVGKSYVIWRGLGIGEEYVS